MKKFIFILMIMIMSGCSSPSDVLDTTPSISNLIYSPANISLNSGNGLVMVTGVFDFVDVDADVNTLVLSIEGVETYYVYNEGLNFSNGQIAISLPVDTTIAGSFDFQLWIKDANGNLSNKMAGNITVQ